MHVQVQRYSVDGFARTFLRSCLGCRWGPPFVLGVPSEWLHRFDARVFWIGCLCVCFKGLWPLAKAFGAHLFFAYGFLLREDYFRFPVMHFGGESVLRWGDERLAVFGVGGCAWSCYKYRGLGDQ
jgi:hypothetical protein